ncbi:MAG: hypothetical protein E7051_08650 [Lentisphaerae bacterium]|nr:hypothetical protein [Lentisphaerota bacterium]
MKSFCSTLICLLLAAVTLNGAERNLIANSKAVPGGAVPLQGVTVVKDPFAEGQYAFKAAAGRCLGSDFIPIDPGKPYLLSGEFAAVGKTGRFVLGFDCYDAGKRKIGAHHIQYVPDTFTTLAATAEKGVSVIKIADGTNWSPSAGKIVIFNAKEDLSDLPNFNNHYYVTDVKKGTDGTQVFFNRPLMRNWKDGTAVRLHKEAGMLNAIAFIQPVKIWEKHSTLIEKVSRDLAIHEHFWAGTRFVKLNFYLYPGDPILIRNLSLIESREVEELPTAKYEYKGAKLIRSFKPQHVVSSDKTAGTWACKIKSYGMLYGQSLNWNADEIKQLEVKFAAQGSPGYLMMIFDTVIDGKKHSSAMRHSVHPDGREHTLLFKTARENAWKGTVENIKFIYYALDPAEISFNSIYGRDHENLIPDVENIPLGQPFSPGTLWPRGEYKLIWQGEENPGVSINILDRNYRSIERVELSGGSKELSFTMPTMAADAEITVNKSGRGIPVITCTKWLERHQMPISWDAQWIWCRRGPGPENSNVWFRKKFTLDSDVRAAVVAMSVDDRFKLHVNGKVVGSGWPYFVTFKFDISRYLRKGENEIIIEAYNGDTWGGALLEGYIRTEKGEMRFCSDESWDYFIGGQSAPSEYIGKAVSMGQSVSAFPWGNRITLRYIGKAAEFKIIGRKDNTFTAEVSAVPPVKRERMRMKVVTKSGKIRYINPEIKVVSGSLLPGSTVTIKYAPPYPETEELTLYCDDDFFYIKDNEFLGKIAAVPAPVKPLSTVKIKNADSRPTLDVDGKDLYPLFWQFPQRYNVENYQATLADSRYAASGINGILIYMEESIRPDGSYDFAKVSERVAVLLNENPDALIMYCAYLYMPEWWLQKFPDNRGLDRQGKALRPGYNTALASLKWREFVDEYLRELVRFTAKQSWGHKVMGVSFFESSNSEWFWEPGGYSASDLESFRKHIQRKYPTLSELRKAWNRSDVTFENIQQPDVERVKSGTVGSLLDPLKDQYLIDWFEFRNAIFAEQIIAFGKSLKEAAGGKWLAGAYYGYFMECAASSRSLQDHGHNGFLEVARSPYIDFVRAPSRYIMRKLGMADGIMQLPDSFKLRDKIVYIEQDFRSFTANEKEGHHGRHNIPIDTVGALNRAFGMMLASGCSQYILDFGRWLYEPMLLDILREQATAFAALPPVIGTTPYEFAVVGARTSAYYARKNGTFTIVDGVTASFMRKINHLPMPFRQVALEDLVEPGIVPPMKFYVMLAPIMITAEQRKELMKRFDREHATVLFLHSAGETYPDKSPSAENCGDFFGIKMAMDMKVAAPQMFYGKDKSWNDNPAASPNFYPVSGFDEVLGTDAADRPMLVRKKVGNATIFFATQLSLPLELISELAKKSGVHHYAELSSDVWWIGNDIAMIYAAADGEKSVTLPAGCVMEQIAGPQLAKKDWQSNEKFPARAGQAYIFVVKKK